MAENWINRSALGVGKRAPCTEPAAGANIDRTWNLALKTDPGTNLGLGIRYWDGREKCLRVWVAGRVIQVFGATGLDDPAEVHHGGSVGYMLNDREIVGDEEASDPEFSLQVRQQVDDLCLHGNVQSRHWLVADQHIWP